MELRQLRAFVTVATELHFGHAAERLYVSPTTLSEIIKRLEDELGTPLFIRTTRHVDLTAAGAELLGRARSILLEVDAAEFAVRQIANVEAGTISIGVIPPAAPVLAGHLVDRFRLSAPHVTLEVRRLWLWDLLSDLETDKIDVGITCGEVGVPDGVTSRDLCAERLLVGLRPDHPLAERESVSLTELETETLGISSERLFPGWTLCQLQALEAAGISPPAVELHDTDLTASRWMQQSDVDWVLLISSLCSVHTETVFRPITPAHLVPFTLHWKPSRARTPAVQRFVEMAMNSDPPAGWATLRTLA